MLANAGCDLVYAPSEEEVYPKGVKIKSDFDFNGLDKLHEGKFRPGHFKGVAMVVNRLLELVDPDMLFMGQKDYQQTLIVKKMIAQTGSDVELVVCPTIRESNGLARSSTQ